MSAVYILWLRQLKRYFRARARIIGALGQPTRALQHYLGHRNIQHTTRYTELMSGRFERWWD